TWLLLRRAAALSAAGRERRYAVAGGSRVHPAGCRDRDPAPAIWPRERRGRILARRLTHALAPTDRHIGAAVDRHLGRACVPVVRRREPLVPGHRGGHAAREGVES